MPTNVMKLMKKHVLPITLLELVIGGELDVSRKIAVYWTESLPLALLVAFDSLFFCPQDPE